MNFEESKNLSLDANSPTLIWRFHKELSKKYINLGGLEINSFKKAGAKASVSFDAEADSVLRVMEQVPVELMTLSGTANYTYKLYDDYPDIFGVYGMVIRTIGPTWITDTALKTYQQIVNIMFLF